MSASLVFHLIREHLIGQVLDLDRDKCAKNRILFVLLIKKLVSIRTVYQCQNYSIDLQNVSHFIAWVHAVQSTSTVVPYFFQLAT